MVYIYYRKNAYSIYTNHFASAAVYENFMKERMFLCYVQKD